MAVVAEKAREGLPIVGVTKDRQILRGVNSAMENVFGINMFLSCSDSYECGALAEMVA